MRRIPLWHALLAGVAVGCTGTDPVAPPVTDPPVASIQHVVATAAATPTVLSAVPGIEDALRRVLPTLPASREITNLQASLESLRDALLREDGTATRSALRAAGDALTRLGRSLSDDHDSDLDAVELALEAAGESGGANSGGRPRPGRS